MRTPALRDFTFTSVTVDPAGKVVTRPAGSGTFYAEDLGSLDLDMVAIEGGTFLMQDVHGTSRVEEDAAHPLGTFLYTVSCLHCMTVSLAAGGAGLGAMWGAEAARRMLAEAGFADVVERTLPHDRINLFYVARKPG